MALGGRQGRRRGAPRRIDTYNVIRYNAQASAHWGRRHRQDPEPDSMGIVSFADQGTEDVFNGENTRKARRTCPESLWLVARRKLDQINAATALSDLRCPPGNELEALKGDRKGQHSIRINRQYRVCFVWTDSGPADVEIVDYH